jgi:hypothetical protein
MRGNRAIKRLVNKLGGFKPYSDSDFPEPVGEEPSEIVESEGSTDDTDGDNDRKEIDY